MDKGTTAKQALAGLTDGATLAVGGFGLCGIPSTLIAEVHNRGVSGLKVVSNNCGVDDWGLGVLLKDKRLDRVTGSYVGENKEFARQYLSGELEVELCPQGSLAERLRAGGCGIAAFYTPAGVGTQIADGGIPWRYGTDGTVAVASPKKDVRDFNGIDYMLEEAITADFALVAAAKGDRYGNLVFDKSAQNFNPLCAMAGAITVAEVECLVEPGELAPHEIHLPGVFVHHVVHAPDREKRIEKTTVTQNVAR